MRTVALILSCLSFAACHETGHKQPPRIDPEAAKLSSDSPYGFWSTERGQTIDVRRDGTFVYCDNAVCVPGKTRPDPHASGFVWLVDFNRLAATDHLREISEHNWEVKFDPVRDEPDFQFGNGASEAFRRNRCRGRPCVAIGKVEGDIYRFVKLKDY